MGGRLCGCAEAAIEGLASCPPALRSESLSSVLGELHVVDSEALHGVDRVARELLRRFPHLLRRQSQKGGSNTKNSERAQVWREGLCERQ